MAQSPVSKNLFLLFVTSLVALHLNISRAQESSSKEDEAKEACVLTE